MEAASKEIYIIITQTGTVLSRILKFITRRDYNHASISVYPDLHKMYSFGRLNPYNPFWGGFVEESKDFGTFKRFRNTEAMVLSVAVSDDTYDTICKTLNSMIADRKNYHYNYLGLWLASVKIHRQAENCYYCSEFVKHILLENGIEGADNLEKIVHPMHFLSLPDAKNIYCGKLRDFSA